MARPGDEIAAAGSGGDGHLRASRADREQVVELLKAAFVEDRLTKEELDARVGQALASRIYADLAAVTADIPAGPTAAPSRQPARARNRAPRSRTVRDVAIGLGLGLIIAAVIVFGGLLQYTLLLLPLVPIGLALPVVLVASRQQPRSRGQLPPRPEEGGQAPEAQQPGQVGHDPALPRDHPGPGSQSFHARSCCCRSARRAAMARAVWLFTAPQLMPMAAAVSASEKSA